MTINWQAEAEKWMEDAGKWKTAYESEAAQVAELGEDLRNKERLEKDLLRRMSSLERRLSEQKAADPKTKWVKEVFAFWQAECHHPKAKLGERRVAVVGKALEQYEVDDLKKAVKGAARFPYVTDHGRSKTGTKRQRHDELELICRNEVKIEQFMRLADRPDDEGATVTPIRPQPAGPFTVHLDPDPFPDGVLDRFLVVMGREFGAQSCQPLNEFSKWLSLCPCHPDDGQHQLVVERPTAASMLTFDCGQGCRPTQVREAYDRIERRQLTRALSERIGKDGPTLHEVLNAWARRKQQRLVAA